MELDQAFKVVYEFAKWAVDGQWTEVDPETEETVGLLRKRFYRE